MLIVNSRVHAENPLSLLLMCPVGTPCEESPSSRAGHSAVRTLTLEKDDGSSPRKFVLPSPNWLSHCAPRSPLRSPELGHSPLPAPA
jgi:hypothetical protein